MFHFKLIVMKKIVFISIIAVLFCSFREPENIKWYSLSEGMELARRENKPVFLFVYVSWCDKCKRMEKKIFPDKEVLPLITENFIPIKINPEVDTAYLRNDKIIKRKIFLEEVEPGKLMLSVPTTVLYMEKDNINQAIRGLQDPTELKETMGKFLKKIKR